MDETRFDNLTRQFATSRRGALKLALGGLLGGLAESALTPVESQAARRGFSGPSNPFEPSVCTIAGATVQANTIDTQNPCQRCDPALDPTAWSPIPGAFCGDGSQVCCDGNCCEATHCCGLNETCTPCRCAIDGALIAGGTPHPTSDCLVCEPSASTTGWSPRADQSTCGGVAGRVCCNGECCAPTECCQGIGICEECGPHCHIGNVDFPAGTINPNDDCDVCDPERSLDGWSNAVDGVECDGGNGCCTGGLCGSCSCTIGNDRIPDGTHNSRNDCEECSYFANPTDWTNRRNGASCGTDRDCCDGECCPTGQCCTIDGCELCCHVGSEPVADGVVNRTNTCQICDASRDFSDWTTLRDGDACGAGDNSECCNGECCPAGQCCRNGECGLCDCQIGSESVPPDTINLANSCEICKPASNRFGWSAVTSGVACGSDGGACCGGECCSRELCCLLDACGECLCSIDNENYPPQTPHPDVDCQWCDPAVDPFGWSTAPNKTACGDSGSQQCCNGLCCDEGFCCLGDACRPCSCFIDGQEIAPETRNLANDCQICTPSLSTEAWSFIGEGEPCGDAGVQCCQSGTCEICGCLIDDEPIPDGAQNPNNECQQCDRALDPSGWSPRNETVSCGPAGDGVCCNGVCCPAGNQCNLDDICEPIGCQIEGTNYSFGTVRPGERCDICDPANPFGWTPRAIPDCPPPCIIGGVVIRYGTTAPEDPCRICRGGEDWSLLTGPGCGEPESGCTIDGQIYADGTENPANPCESCQLTSSETAWMPKFNACGPTGEQFCCNGICCDLGACCNNDDVCAFDACETCVIDGQLWFPEDRNPANGCEMCIANSNKFAWTPLPDFSWCDEMQITTCCAGICCEPGTACQDGICVPL